MSRTGHSAPVSHSYGCHADQLAELHRTHRSEDASQPVEAEDSLAQEQLK